MSSKKYKKKAPVLGNGNKWFDLVALLPLAAVLAIVPLIVKMYAYDNGLEQFDFYLQSGSVPDFFNYYKMVTFVVIAVIMAFFVAAKLIVEKKNIKFSKLFIPLFVYGALALFSSMASKYKPYPWTGIYEQFESCWVLLGYVLVAYYAFLFVNKKEDILFLVGALAVSTVFMIAIGISQAFFTDFFQTNFGQHLIVPKKYHSDIFVDDKGLDFTFEKGRVYLTLYNPNYVGSYAALLTPLFMMMVFASKHIAAKAAYVILYIGVVFALLGSQSDAGLAGTMVAMLLLVPLFAKFKLKYWLPVLLVLAVSVGAIKLYSDRTGRHGFFEVLKNAINVPETTYSLTDIETTDHDVAMTYLGNDLHITFDPETVAFGITDSSGAEVENTYNGDFFSRIITDERFAGITLTPIMLSDDLLGFQVGCLNEWNFAVYEGDYYYFTPYGKFIKMRSSETWNWLARKGNFGSGRGSIWAKTVPLLKSYVLLGSGADTFSIVYPNYDFLSMWNTGYWQQIVTKPHNMYLQIGVQTGVFSLIAMLVFYFIYFINCLLVSVKTKKHNFYSMVSGAIAAGTAGYMVSQLINDSTITVAPIYWALIGTGYATCLMAKRENELQENAAKQAADDPAKQDAPKDTKKPAAPTVKQAADGVIKET